VAGPGPAGRAGGGGVGVIVVEDVTSQ
jgi:hypothetical protein